MIAFLTVVHVIVCIMLIISILLQSSKGGGMAGMFGGGGSVGGVFGGRGAASFLAKTTMWLGVMLGITTMSIALLSLKTGPKAKSMLQQVSERERQASPADMLPVVPEQPAPQK